jgi:homoserine dehydrogenase
MLEALERTGAVRRLLVDRFDERAIAEGEAMSMLNMRFAHVYLHHRYALEGAIKYVGGMDFTYALRGDGQTPARILPGGRTAAGAGRMLLNHLEPAELRIPDRVSNLIPPRLRVWTARRSGCRRRQATAFDAITSAGGLATEIVENLLHRDRLARVSLFHSRDAGNPAVAEVLEAVMEASWGEGTGGDATAQALRRTVQRVVLNTFLDLGGDSRVVPEVRAGIEHQLTGLRTRVEGESGGGTEWTGPSGHGDPLHRPLLRWRRRSVDPLSLPRGSAPLALRAGEPEPPVEGVRTSAAEEQHDAGRRQGEFVPGPGGIGHPYEHQRSEQQRQGREGGYTDAQANQEQDRARDLEAPHQGCKESGKGEAERFEPRDAEAARVQELARSLEQERASREEPEREWKPTPAGPEKHVTGEFAVRGGIGGIHGGQGTRSRAIEESRGVAVPFRMRSRRPARRPAPRPVSVALVGPGQVGRAVLRQLAGITPRLRAERVADLRVVAIATSRRMSLSSGFSDPVSAVDELRRGDGDAGGGGTEDVELASLAAHLRSEGSDAETVPILVDATASDEVADQYAAWLRSGIHIVTPNKRAGSGPLSRWLATRDAARSSGAHWRFEATVGAGLPVISTLRDLVATGDEIRRIDGVLSGSLAFLLHARDEGTSFSTSIPEASRRGYLEPDPRDDLSGMDVARKLVILAREAGSHLELSDVAVEGLVPDALAALDRDRFMERLDSLDEELEARLSDLASPGGAQRIRHLARFTPEKGASVGPVALPAAHALANLGSTGNAVAFTTHRYAPEPLSIQGPGAGPEVTAAGVLGDLLRVVAEA